MDSGEKIKKTKMKSIFKIPLIIILGLIIVVIGLGAFIYFNDGNTKEIYSKVIDNVFNSVSKNLENGKDILKANGNINIEMVGTNLDTYEQSLMDIINDISIEYDLEANLLDEKTNIKLNAKYNEAELLTMTGNVIDGSAYIKIPSIYDKTIKANESEVSVINNKEIVTLINEFKNIIKNNLKEEYFSKEKVVLNINDKKVYTTKHTLEITAQELFELEKKIIDDIKESDKIITILSDGYGIDKNELINKLNSYRNELEYDETLSVKMELYTNLLTKKIERISLIDEESIIITRNDKNNYDITHNQKDISNIIGNVKVAEDKFELSINYDGVKINYEVNDDNVNIKVSSEGVTFSGNITNKDDKSNMLYELSYEEDGMKIKLSMDGVIEETDNVSDKIITDYVLIDEITDEDYLSIYENLYNNETLMKLITDISEIYENIYSSDNISGTEDSLSTF